MNYEQLMTDYWGRIVPMVAAYNAEHKTHIWPWRCVKLSGEVPTCHPAFNRPAERYELALTIFEGEPLFKGDELYDARTGKPVSVMAYAPTKQGGSITVAHDTIPIRYFTRKKPKNEPEYAVFVPCERNELDAWIGRQPHRKLKEGEVLVLTYDEVNEILLFGNFNACKVLRKLADFQLSNFRKAKDKNDKPS